MGVTACFDNAKLVTLIAMTYEAKLVTPIAMTYEVGCSNRRKAQRHVAQQRHGQVAPA